MPRQATNQPINIEASGYHDSRVKLLQEVGFVEDFQFNTREEAMNYVATILDIYPKIVVIHFADGHYAVWTEV